MKRRKNSFRVMLMILIFYIWVLPVFAATEEKKGTIEINAKKDMKVEYVKVGDIVDGEYILRKEYKKSSVNLNHLKYAEEAERAAKKLSPYVKAGKIIMTDKEGKAKIKNLSQGIYLIRYSNVPVLITIPEWDEKRCDLIYDITIIPKLEEAEAPQTGLYSPIKTYLVITMALLMCAAMFSYKAQKEYRPYKISGQKRAQLQREVVKEISGNPFQRKIDFEKLKKENLEIYGWIYIPDTRIDDPILIGKTNTEYLHKNFRGERSALGSIFGFMDMAKDFSDTHICLFGHNTRSAQMFGELKKYRDPQFAKEHQDIYIYTPNEIKWYKVFSVYDCDKKNITFDCKVQPESKELAELTAYMLEENKAGKLISEEEAEFLEYSEILTLASCSHYRETAERFTVNAFRKDKKG